MKRVYLITPFLFTLAFVLYINYWTLTVVSPNQLIRPLIVLLILLGLLMYTIYRTTHNLELISLLSTVFVFGFYFSQTFFEIVGTMVFAAILFWLIYFRLRGFKIAIRQIFILLNTIAVTIVTFCLYVNIGVFAKVPWSTYLRSVNQAANYSIENLSDPVPEPDIYYIILDGYPRSNILKEFFGYDNHRFTTYLQERGFIVPTDNHSNYGKTAASLPSTLNMDYVDSFAPGLRNSHFGWLMVPFLNHSRTSAILESQGYKILYLSTWSVTDDLPNTFSRPYPIMLNDYERYFLGITPLRYAQPLLKNIASVPTYETHRRMINYFMESLRKLPQTPGPKFIFAHVTAPHPPFVFDRNGNPTKLSGSFQMNDADEFGPARADYQKGYIEQIQYLNSQMQTIVDIILKQSKTPPIIIIQADHGSGLFTDFSSAANTCVRERFSPFAAYYLPGKDENVIPPNISSVNIFRIIFNQYFHANLPLLENKQYYYRDKIYLYRFVDVTSRVNEQCVMP